MFLKNNAKRLISINSPMVIKKNAEGKVVGATPGKVYDILPAGPSVEVPDDVGMCDYVEALIDCRDLSITDENEDVFNLDDLSKNTKAELETFAEDISAEYPSGSNKATIIEAIEAKLAEDE